MEDRSEEQTHYDPKSERALESVKAALSALRFGAIQLTIHEGRVVQLDVTERQRFPL